jgi:hypothetical protein
VSDEAVPAVDSQRVALIEPPHAHGQIRLRRPDQEVIVVGHQAVGMASPAEVSHDIRQVLQEPRSIEVVVEDRQSPNAAAAHVIRRFGLDDEGAWSLHAVSISE